MRAKISYPDGSVRYVYGLRCADFIMREGKAHLVLSKHQGEPGEADVIDVEVQPGERVEIASEGR